MTTSISVEHLSKAYHLGQIGTGTLSRDLEVWWAKKQGKPNPLLRISDKDHHNPDGEALWALKDVSFKVERGDVLGVIGRNGAGKSTLLKILSRVTAPTSGRVKVKGRIASLLEVGTGFHAELTGRENIYLNGAILGMSRKEIDRKFDEILDFSEVEKFIDTPVKRYSSGMYVRLAFAVAAHLEPEILVVDEVLAVGDAEFQKKCLGKMQDISSQGRTVLFVSHNMASITSLCSRALYLHRGQLALDNEVPETVKAYLRGISGNMDTSVSERSDRSGNGLVRVKSIKLVDQQGSRIEIAASGEDVSVLIEYYVPSGEIIEDGVCILVFKTHMGQPLFSCSTRLFNEYVRLLPKGQLLCTVMRLPLNQGNYYIDLMIKRGPVSMEILDQLDSAIQFQVVGGDYFKTGRSANPVSSPMLVLHNWIGINLE